MSDIVIKVENISKQYRLGSVGTGSLAHDLNRSWHRIRGKEDPYLKIGEANDRAVKGNSEYVWALQDINFEVKQGEVLGIIGRNGAGKSTLLKILSRTTTPTTGKIKIKGRVASLLEVGTGFHPELSGRENIFLNGAILGMTKQEIKSKFDEIVDFAGVERYIDTPVKRYSSGMYVRLAFGVAAHLEPEILIVDEVLAVGDAEFQKKALGKMKDVSGKDGRTVLFVSHNMAAVENLCNTGMLLVNGKLNTIGSSKKIISDYIDSNSNDRLSGDLNLINHRKGSGELKFVGIKILDAITKKEISDIQCGADICFRLFYDANTIFKNMVLALGINDQYDQRVCFLSNELIGKNIEINACNGSIDFYINHIPLTIGRYNLTLFCSANGNILDWIHQAFYFDIISGDFYKTGKNAPENNGAVLLNYSIL
jgi:lipopolysaccharide transport system ATP-binding protein